MASKIDSVMSTSVALETLKASNSINSLTKAVRSSTSAWKAQEATLKSAGEYQKAAAARVDGLAKSIEMQKAKIDELKSRQSGLNRDTKSGEEQYLKLTDQINKASRSYDSMGGQLDRAKSKLQYYNSGLADLQKGYKQSTALSKSYVERLEAEGRSAEANKAKLGGLKQAYSNMEAQYKAQTSELERIKTASGATSDAYKRQQVRVNETATSMAKLKIETNELDSAMKKSNASAFTKMLDSAKHKLGLVRDEEKKTNDETKHFAIGFAIGNTISNAASSAVGYIKGVTKQGYELAEAGATIKKQWTNLGLSDSEATKITAQIGDIRSKANMSGGAIDAMQKKFYAMTNSTTKARAMTEVLTSYGSAAGKSGDQIAGLTQGVAKLAGSSKVTASLFKRNFSQVPELQKAIVKASGMSTTAFNKQLAAGKITGSQLQGYMVKAAKTSGKAWSEFGDTTKGKMAAIKGTYTNLKVAFAKPLVAGVEKAIDGISEKKGALDKVKNSLTTLVGALGKKTGQYVGNVIKFLAKNEKPIEKMGGAFASIVGSLAKGAWSAVAGALKLIGGHSKDASKGMNGVADATAAIAKHKGAIENVGKAIVTYFAISKLVGIGKAFLGIAGGIGKAIGFIRSLSTAQRLAAKASGEETAAQWLLNAAMDANPIGIVVVALGALTVGLVAAYKYIKPFRKWVNGIGNSMKKLFTGKYGWEKKVGSALGKVGKTMDKWGKNAGSFFKKHRTEILTTLINPFAGLATWFLKDTKTGKNIQKWSKGFSKDIQKMGFKKAMDKQVNDASKAFSKTKFGKWFKTVSDSFNTWKSSFGKSWNSHWSAMGKSLKNSWNSSVKHTKEFFSSVGKKWDSWKPSFKKSWSSHWNTTTSNLHSAWNKSYKHTRDFFSGMGTKWVSWKKSFAHSWDSHWDTMRSNLHSYWNKDLSHTKVFGRSMGSWLSTFRNSFKSGWSSLGNGIESIFKGLWKDLKGFARDGMNDVIDIINSGINAVDSVIHTFGGKKKTIADLSHVHFATGTGIFSGSRNPITKPTLAMLNDGNDSPQTGNKEMIMLPNGDSGIVQGRNTKMMLPAGTEVLNASETAMLMSMQGVTKYAKGTGFFGDILNSVTSGISGVTSWVGKKVGSLEKFFKTATNIIAHPIKSLENLFSWSSKGVSGVMSSIGHGLFNGVEKQAKTWWSTLWSMVDLDGAGGDASGLLGAVEKYGKGKSYVWGAAGPNEFDCSGLVMYALKHAFGIDFPHFSGSQIAKTQHVSAANAKPGDLIGNNEHIGVYAGNGKYWSAMSPSSHPNIGMSSVSSFPGTPIYGRVRGLSNGDDKDASKGVKANSGLEKTIKSQVGGGFWKFISKLADMFGDDGGSGDVPAGDAVGRWRPDVKKALDTLGLSTSSSMIAKVLRQINTESSGNPKAMGGTDGLADGHAEGLMQVKPGTFSAYHLSGHNNIWNGYDNMLAGLNYAKHRYGSGLSFLGNGHGYANGGIANTPSIFGEAGPEMAIPLSMTRSDRANQLLGETVVHMAKNNPDRLANGGNYLTGSHDLTEIKALLKDTIGKLNEVVQAVYNTALTDQSIHNANKRETDKVNYLRNLGKGLI